MAITSSTAVPQELQTRQMVYEDIDSVSEIESSGHLQPWPSSQFKQSIDQTRREAWVICLNTKIYGYFVISLAGGEAELLNLSVNPTYHRQGIGSKLMEHVFTKVATHADTIFLEVRRSNIAAIELYYQHGFDQVGERKNYYPGPAGREDALIMAKPIVVF